MELWELVDWDTANMKFSKLDIPPDFNMTELRFEWVGTPQVEFELQGTAPSGFRTTPQHPIESENGSPIDGCPDYNSLAATIVSRVPLEIGQKHLSEAASETLCPVDLSIQIPENPQMSIGDGRFAVSPVRVVGVIRKRSVPSRHI